MGCGMGCETFVLHALRKFSDELITSSNMAHWQRPERTAALTLLASTNLRDVKPVRHRC